MLSKRHSLRSRGNMRARQSGVVLLITLIVLVAMTLTAIAMVRSMDTTNIIAGNMAFQQSATQSGETGIEAAIVWLETNSAVLQTDSFINGYKSSFTNPAGNQTWDQYFSALEAAGRTKSLPKNAIDNTVTYSIERLCLNAGLAGNDPNAACTAAPKLTFANPSHEPGDPPLAAATQVYYRITSRTVGPHNAKSYIQTVVAL
jgi:type IV pilus assembly protein PilX